MWWYRICSRNVKEPIDLSRCISKPCLCLPLPKNPDNGHSLYILQQRVNSTPPCACPSPTVIIKTQHQTSVCLVQMNQESQYWHCSAEKECSWWAPYLWSVMFGINGTMTLEVSRNTRCDFNGNEKGIILAAKQNYGS